MNLAVPELLPDGFRIVADGEFGAGDVIHSSGAVICPHSHMYRVGYDLRLAVCYTFDEAVEFVRKQARRKSQ